MSDLLNGIIFSEILCVMDLVLPSSPTVLYYNIQFLSSQYLFPAFCGFSMSGTLITLCWILFILVSLSFSFISLWLSRSFLYASNSIFNYICAVLADLNCVVFKYCLVHSLFSLVCNLHFPFTVSFSHSSHHFIMKASKIYKRWKNW